MVYGVCGEPGNFTISTKGAGAGGLSLAVEGPSKAEISCHDNKDGTVSVSYLPTAPGEYKITVKFGDKHIKGSPFVAKITGKCIKRLFDFATTIYSKVLSKVLSYQYKIERSGCQIKKLLLYFYDVFFKFLLMLILNFSFSKFEFSFVLMYVILEVSRSFYNTKKRHFQVKAAREIRFP